MSGLIMPIYEYQCAACGHQLEMIQKFSDEPLKDCPACSKAELQKLISSSAFHLKGGGWYVTDIRDKDKKKPDAASDSSSTTTASESATSTPAPTSSTEKPSGGSSSNSTDSSAV
jgi:putative FmdB family regulatory protein